MGLFEIFLIGISLSMDAFAVSICKGLKMKKLNIKQGLIVALFFGVFQGAMPLIGFYVGTLFADYITTFDHWIAFILLAIIGGKMIYDAIKDMREKRKYVNIESAEVAEEVEEKFSIKELFILAIATSIDALAVGISFATGGLNLSVWVAALIICCITFAFSLVGVIIGNKFGAKYKEVPVLIGGLVLIGIGTKILIEHLFF